MLIKMNNKEDPDNKANNEAPLNEAPLKEAYEFGTIQKIVLETKELEYSIFACMHGVDGCDPRRGTICSGPAI